MKYFASILFLWLLIQGGWGVAVKTRQGIRHFSSTDSGYLSDQQFYYIIKVYIVKKGDSLQSIAKNFHMPVGYLVYANKISASHVLHVGKKINIPALVYHKVVKGDTVASIAYKYGVSARKIRQLNQLKKVFVGQVVLIPPRKIAGIFNENLSLSQVINILQEGRGFTIANPPTSTSKESSLSTKSSPSIKSESVVPKKTSPKLSTPTTNFLTGVQNSTLYKKITKPFRKEKQPSTSKATEKSAEKVTSKPTTQSPSIGLGTPPAPITPVLVPKIHSNTPSLIQKTQTQSLPPPSNHLMEKQNIVKPYNPSVQKSDRGILLKGHNNMSVRSIQDGIVIYEGKDSTGLFIFIQYESNIVAIYSHLSRLAVHKTDTVAKGTIIGNLKGSELFFQMLNNGKVINPTIYLP